MPEQTRRLLESQAWKELVRYLSPQPLGKIIQIAPQLIDFDQRLLDRKGINVISGVKTGVWSTVLDKLVHEKITDEKAAECALKVAEHVIEKRGWCLLTRTPYILKNVRDFYIQRGMAEEARSERILQALEGLKANRESKDKTMRRAGQLASHILEERKAKRQLTFEFRE